jgi:hypothetical protein
MVGVTGFEPATSTSRTQKNNLKKCKVGWKVWVNSCILYIVQNNINQERKLKKCQKVGTGEATLRIMILI